MQEISDKMGDHQYAKLNVRCEDCNEDFDLDLERIAEDKIEVKNGTIAKKNDKYMFKCQECFETNDFFGMKTEVYSRVVGYLRPISSWNQSKKNEFHQRKMYKID